MSEKYVGDVQVTPVEKAQSVPEEQLEEALVQKKPTVRADKLAQADPKPLVTKKGLKKNDKQVPEEAASKDRFELRKVFKLIWYAETAVHAEACDSQ